jgi:hypothetical protein
MREPNLQELGHRKQGSGFTECKLSIENFTTSVTKTVNPLNPHEKTSGVLQQAFDPGSGIPFRSRDETLTLGGS